jgi:hypothetical protein
MQEITLQAKANVELFRGQLKGSSMPVVSPLDGYRYADDELIPIAMNEADEETDNNVIYLFTIAQRKPAASICRISQVQG